MPRDLPRSFATAYAVVAADLMRSIGDTLAAEAGPPTSVEVDPVTERQRIEAWDTPHPEATDAAMWQLARSKYAEHRQSGMDDATARLAVAEDLTHFRYRARQPLYVAGTVGWAEQVREAERLSRASARRGRAPEAPIPGPAPESLPRGPYPAAPPAIVPGPNGTAPPTSTPTPPEAPDPETQEGLTDGH